MTDETRARRVEAYVVECMRPGCPYESGLVADVTHADDLVDEHEDWHDLLSQPLPPGRYPVEMTTIVHPDAPTGQGQRWGLRIVDGPQKGRVIYDGAGWFEVSET